MPRLFLHSVLVPQLTRYLAKLRSVYFISIPRALRDHGIIHLMLNED